MARAMTSPANAGPATPGKPAGGFGRRGAGPVGRALWNLADSRRLSMTSRARVRQMAAQGALAEIHRRRQFAQRRRATGPDP